MEMYTEDWIIAHRRWVWLGQLRAEGQEARSEPIGPALLLICPLSLQGQLAFSGGSQEGWMALQASHGPVGVPSPLLSTLPCLLPGTSI